MDSHHQPNNDQEMPAKNGGSVLRRRRRTRWTPTKEQLRILKELYYNGVHYPTVNQIQRISAELRQYGNIEGRNVVYWFQNHKAREREKKRSTADHPIPPIHRPSPSPAHHHLHYHHLYNKFSNINNRWVSLGIKSSPGVISHVGNYGYGSSLAMKISFRECSISASGNGGGGSMGQNYAWIYPYASSPYPFLEKTSYAIGGQTLEVEPTDQYDEEEAAIETLQLFPVHAGDTIKHENDYLTGWNRHSGDDSGAMASRASLELTLNSYAARFPFSLN